MAICEQQCTAVAAHCRCLVGADAAMQKVDRNQCLHLTRCPFFGRILTYVNVRSKASRQRETLISNGTQRPDDPHHRNKTTKTETLVRHSCHVTLGAQWCKTLTRFSVRRVVCVRLKQSVKALTNQKAHVQIRKRS